jgi:hypothetical protein
LEETEIFLLLFAIGTRGWFELWRVCGTGAGELNGQSDLDAALFELSGSYPPFMEHWVLWDTVRGAPIHSSTRFESLYLTDWTKMDDMIQKWHVRTFEQNVSSKDRRSEEGVKIHSVMDFFDVS